MSPGCRSKSSESVEFFVFYRFKSLYKATPSAPAESSFLPVIRPNPSEKKTESVRREPHGASCPKPVLKKKRVHTIPYKTTQNIPKSRRDLDYLANKKKKSAPIKRFA